MEFAMRQRERIIRIISEEAEKLGLDPKQKFEIKDMKPQVQHVKEDKNSSIEVTSEEKEAIVQEEPAPKKKIPFSPKKKKESVASEPTDE
jgi:hypothetical protein